MIYGIQGVSFPRSGQSALQNAINLYFSDHTFGFGYGYVGGISMGVVDGPTITYAKNHDMMPPTYPQLPQLPHIRYLVQYRSPVRSFVSQLKLGNYTPEKLTESVLETQANNFIKMWSLLINKWVININTDVEFHSDIQKPYYYYLHIPYEELILNSSEILTKVIQFMCDEPVDTEKLGIACDSLTVRKSMENWFIPPDFICEYIEKELTNEMCICNLPTWRSDRSV